MQSSQSPTLVPLAFAANGTKNTISEGRHRPLRGKMRQVARLELDTRPDRTGRIPQAGMRQEMVASVVVRGSEVVVALVARRTGRGFPDPTHSALAVEVAAVAVCMFPLQVTAAPEAEVFKVCLCSNDDEMSDGNYAVVENGVVTNIVVWEGGDEWSPPADATVVMIPAGTFMSIGYTYDGTTFAEPTPN